MVDRTRALTRYNQTTALSGDPGFKPILAPLEELFELLHPFELRLPQGRSHKICVSAFAVYTGEHVTWHRPVELQKLLDLKKQFPAARLVRSVRPWFNPGLFLSGFREWPLADYCSQSGFVVDIA